MAQTATIMVAGEPASVSEARAAVAEVAAGRLPGDALRTTQLLVSELVTNGIVHGGVGRPLEIAVELGEEAVRVDVADHGPGFDLRAGGPDENGGWGLLLVDRLADRWGMLRNGATHVWFEIAIDASR